MKLYIQQQYLSHKLSVCSDISILYINFNKALNSPVYAKVLKQVRDYNLAIWLGCNWNLDTQSRYVENTPSLKSIYLIHEVCDLEQEEENFVCLFFLYLWEGIFFIMCLR